MLPQSPRQLKWKGPPTPRAKPIPREQWEEHKVELVDLYERMTIDELMVAMQVKHNFAPSRRQYIFQFEKWGISKYKRNVKGHSSPLAGSHTITSDQSPPWPESHAFLTQHPLQTRAEQGLTNHQHSQQLPILGPSKRPPSDRSLREKPPVPPKKRQKLADFLASRTVAQDPYANLALAFDTPMTSLADPQMPAPQRRMTNSAPSGTPARIVSNVDMASAISTTSGDTDEDVEMDMGTPRMSCDDESWITQSASRASMTTSSSVSYNALLQYYSGRWTSQEHLLSQESLVESHFDGSRPVDTFSWDEIADIKLAADFLSGLGCEEDAFALYILIFKRLKGDPNQPSSAISSAIISCATCAFTSAQIEIAQNLLQQKLNEPQEFTTTIEEFVFRMLLAETYVAINDDAIARSHIEIAMGLDIFDHDHRARGLLSANRRFDILTYFYLIDGLGYRTTLRDDNGFDYQAYELLFESLEDWEAPGDLEFPNDPAQKLPFLNKWEAWGHLLQVPGPFEIREGSMANPYLRSCLQWCVDELGRMPTFVLHMERCECQER